MPPLRRSTSCAARQAQTCCAALNMDSSLWEGAALVNTAVIPETGALTLQCSGTHLGADASDEVRALVEGVSSCSLTRSVSFGVTTERLCEAKDPFSEPSFLPVQRAASRPAFGRRRSALHLHRLLVPLQVRFAGDPVRHTNGWARDCRRSSSPARKPQNGTLKSTALY